MLSHRASKLYKVHLLFLDGKLLTIMVGLS